MDIQNKKRAETKRVTFVFVNILVLFLLISFVSAARLPVVGGDTNNWGAILNSYLTRLAGPNATTLNVSSDATFNQNISVLGNINTSNNISANYFIGDGSQLTGIPLNGLWTNSSGNATYLTGNVGLGMESPTSKLEVNGNINIVNTFAYLYDGVQALRLTKGTDSFYANTFVGAGAGNISAREQTAFGYNAGSSNLGSNAVSIGYNAGYQNAGPYQTALGSSSGYQNTGDSQTALGSSSGYKNTGDNQVVLGYYTGYENTGNSQTALGYSAGVLNTGNSQTALGYNAGRSNTGNNTIGIGYYATYGNFGNDVVAIGYYAGKGNTVANQFIVKQASVNSVPLIQGDFSSGNVGIGTTTPGYKLDVNGTINSANKITASNSTGTVNGGFSFTQDGGQDTGMFSPSDGVIDFYNNNAKTLTIDSSGNMAFVGTGKWLSLSGDPNTEEGNINGLNALYGMNDLQLYGNTSGILGISVQQNGNVGIGMVPTHQLELSTDDAVKPSTNTWTIASDRRIKKNINYLTNYSENLNWIKNFPDAITYNYNNLLYPKLQNITNYGFIAQDLKAYAPNMTTTRNTTLTNGTSINLISINTNELDVRMLPAMKELIKKNENLKKEIQNITNKLNIGIAGNYTNGNCWTAYSEGIAYGTNCSVV